MLLERGQGSTAVELTPTMLQRNPGASNLRDVGRFVRLGRLGARRENGGRKGNARSVALWAVVALALIGGNGCASSSRVGGGLRPAMLQRDLAPVQDLSEGSKGFGEEDGAVEEGARRIIGGEEVTEFLGKTNWVALIEQACLHPHNLEASNPEPRQSTDQAQSVFSGAFVTPYPFPVL